MKFQLPNLKIVPIILREPISRKRFPREPEPDLVMDNAEDVAAYREAGRIDGSLAAVYLYHAASICQTIQGCRTVVDLACGPATLLSLVAKLNPQIQFVGVDLSEEMLSAARAHVSSLGLTNVTFKKQDITRLETFSDHSVAGVISTMALHHLPTRDHLEQTFKEIQRILVPEGALYLVDFGRFKSRWSVLRFASMNAAYEPVLFTRDHERSLLSAFSLDDFRMLSRNVFSPNVRVLSSFLVPFFVILKTSPRSLPTELVAQLRDLVKGLSSRYQSDLKAMRLMFKWAGDNIDLFGL